jgi:L-threonylcarbamoyladenylate synthase
MGIQTSDPIQIKAAARLLEQGELVAFPTETVYGLGARADDDTAVAKIFSAKGRPADHPLIVHVKDIEAARQFAAVLPDTAQRLMRACWPGPVTVIVPRTMHLANAAAGGQATIGLRCPAHPVAQALLQAAAHQGVPGIAAPSANRFGRISPTRAQHVIEELGQKLMVLDGGACVVGIESAIVDCSGPGVVLLRPGSLTRAEIEAVLGQSLQNSDSSSPRAPGTLESHYAPQAMMSLMSANDLQIALSTLPAELQPLELAVYARHFPASLSAKVHFQPMPDEPLKAAQYLFKDLRRLDQQGFKQLWVEAPPLTFTWEGVADRLNRAAFIGKPS